MIDRITVGNQHAPVMYQLMGVCQDNFRIKSQDNLWTVYDTGTGISIRFKYQNKNLNKVFLDFSPHKQKNGNIHNADPISIKEAQEQIRLTLGNIGIEKRNFIFWDISAIEIGVNYLSVVAPETILQCFLFYKNARFNQHPLYPHYYYAAGKEGVKGKRNDIVDRKSGDARRNKNCKIKNYCKANQTNNQVSLMYYQLGYCEENVMRFEVNAETMAYCKKWGFTTLDSLFDENILERCIIFLKEHLNEIFVFNPKDIVSDKKLSTPERRKYFQAIAKNFWEGKEKRELRTSKDKWLKLPRKSDTKKIVVTEILKAVEVQNNTNSDIKSVSYFRTEEFESESEGTPLYRGLNLFKNKRLLIDIGNTTHFCVVTGEDISMQRNGEPYLKREGLRFLKSNNPFRYNKIKEKFLSPKLLNASEEKQIENIEKNIKNRIYNEQHNNMSFQRRNYHPHQAQINFL